jgi:sugar transferase EpsL
MNMHPFQRAIKRTLDITVSLSVLVLVFPLLVCIGLSIRWKMGSPIIFRQERPGRCGKTFTFYKFRTMTNEINKDGSLRVDGERLTSFGIFLRRWSLDEFPQLWNVLIGDMSLVGPRPLRIDYLPYFTEREKLRHSVLPGITGWAQINGRNQVRWDKRLELDVWYVENWTLWLDIRILSTTAVRIIRQDNVVVDPHSIMLNLNEERTHMVRSRIS